MTTKKIINTVLVVALVFLGVRYFIYHFVVPSLPSKEISFIQENGDQIKISEFKGKYILISYFQTWCGDCIRELPSIENLQNEIGHDKLITLMVTDESIEKIIKFKKRYNPKLEYYTSPESLQNLGIHVFPTTYLLDQEGNIILSKLEGYDWNSKEVHDLIK